jgi:hypothetical protein
MRSSRVFRIGQASQMRKGRPYSGYDKKPGVKGKGFFAEVLFAILLD